MQIDKLDKQLEVAAHEEQLLKNAAKEQDNEIRDLKASIEKQREEHLKEITKIMNEKMKRRSSKILSSQRSLNDSMKDSNLV
jgi:cell division protein ZapA (FtsZ GTPase activity inhibitor)